MKNKKIIIFIIITSIILIGIICSFINGNKNIITEKQVIKEMSESTQVTDLNNQITALNASHEEYAKNVQAYKTKIAEAITNQGVPTSADSKTETIVENIGKILSAKTQATATAAQILKGQTAWVNGNKITGTMVDRGAVTKTLNAGGSYTIPAGYHNGSGKVTANSLASQTQATATANNITSGKTAYVNGKLIVGTALDYTSNPKLIWQYSYSASSTSFPAQTLNLDLSSYDAVIISLIRVHTSTTRWYFVIPIGTSQVVNMYMNDDNTNVGSSTTWYRLITTSKNSITFGNPLNNASNNYGMLPCEIYGLNNLF